MLQNLSLEELAAMQLHTDEHVYDNQVKNTSGYHSYLGADVNKFNPPPLHLASEMYQVFYLFS